MATDTRDVLRYHVQARWVRTFERSAPFVTFAICALLPATAVLLGEPLSRATLLVAGGWMAGALAIGAGLVARMRRRERRMRTLLSPMARLFGGTVSGELGPLLSWLDGSWPDALEDGVLATGVRDNWWFAAAPAATPASYREGAPAPLPLLVVAHGGSPRAQVTVLVSGRGLRADEGLAGADGLLQGTGFHLDSSPSGIIAAWRGRAGELPGSSLGEVIETLAALVRREPAAMAQATGEPPGAVAQRALDRLVAAGMSLAALRRAQGGHIPARVRARLLGTAAALALVAAGILAWANTVATGQGRDKHGNIIGPWTAFWYVALSLLTGFAAVHFLRTAFASVRVLEGEASSRIQADSRRTLTHRVRVAGTECEVPEALAQALTAGLSYRLYVTARGDQFLALEPVEVAVPRSV